MNFKVKIKIFGPKMLLWMKYKERDPMDIARIEVNRNWVTVEIRMCENWLCCVNNFSTHLHGTFFLLLDFYLYCGKGQIPDPCHSAQRIIVVWFFRIQKYENVNWTEINEWMWTKDNLSILLYFFSLCLSL